MTKKFQLTLAIIKPHILKQPHYLENIKKIILNTNFKIVGSKRHCLSLVEAENFYKEHNEKFFYNRLVTFMNSGLSDFYILSKVNAIQDWRMLMGPTKVFKAQYTHPESIRGSYGFSDTRNAAHGSDSTESAAREIKLFFPEFDIDKWFENEEIYFRTNKIKYLEDEFMHIPIKLD